jgi:uncharacterized protein (TIGR03437 family)
LLLAFWGAGALAQSGPSIVEIGARLRQRVAPGDIVTLQVVGLKTALPGPVKASSLPLPTELAGISVAFRVYGINLPGPPRAAPIFSIEQRPICGDEFPAPPDCRLTSITIQIPLFGAIVLARRVDFAVSENGVSGKAFNASGNLGNIHVLTACSGGSSGSCFTQVPAVTHADGALVTASSPAKPGEVVVIYATGLGETVPPIPAGQATPTPAPRAYNSFHLQFNFSPNAGPGRPYGEPAALPRPEFVGLTPGEIGVYQINVRIPDTIPPVPPCGGSVAGRWPVLSNLTITVTGDIYNNTFDGAAICVAPPEQR